MNAFGFPCKTGGCNAWLKLGEMQEDTLRAIRVPLNLGPDPVRLKCPDCGQEHDYRFTDREIVRMTSNAS